MSLKFEKEEMDKIYNEIRTGDAIKWASFGYKSDTLVGVTGSGDKFEDFVATCTDDVRQYCYASFNTGDEMSVRKKFVFFVWVGDKVKAKLRAAVSTQRSENFATEIQTSSKDDLKVSNILTQLQKIGGANYGRSST